MKRQAERLLEEARRKRMYDFLSSASVSHLQILASARGWKLLATIDETCGGTTTWIGASCLLKGGRLMRHVRVPQAHRTDPFSTLLSEWRRSSLPSLEREIANWKGSRMVDELYERLTQRYGEFTMLLNGILPEYSDLILCTLLACTGNNL